MTKVNDQEVIMVYRDAFVLIERLPSGRRLLECVMPASGSHHKKGDPIVWYPE